MCVYVCQCVWMWMHMCTSVYVQRLCGLCFSFTGGSVHLFVFLVLSPSCVGTVWWCTLRWKVVKQAPVTLSPTLWSFYFCIYFSLSFLSVWLLYLLHFYPLHLFSFSLSLSLSFSLHHKHLQCWHTRVDSHPESSATTIMSMLSSHNNTRITCWGRQALFGGKSFQNWLPWIESVNTSQTCTCWSVKYGVGVYPPCAVFRLYFCSVCDFSCCVWVVNVVVRC